MSHASPLSPSPVSRVPRFARTRITGILFRVQRYSRYSSPLRNGKDGTGRGGSGELVIKEGELGCVPFRGRPVRLKLSNFTPRVPSFLPWLPAMLVVCPTDSLRWCRNSFFECMLLFPLLFTIEVGYANGRLGTLVSIFENFDPFVRNVESRSFVTIRLFGIKFPPQWNFLYINYIKKVSTIIILMGLTIEWKNKWFKYLMKDDRKKNCYYILWCNSIYYYLYCSGFGFWDINIKKCINLFNCKRFLTFYIIIVLIHSF